MPAVTVLGTALSITVLVSSEEAIRRVAVDVSPRVHFGNGTRQTQPTTGSILRVLVLVERPLRSAATKGPKGPWKRWRHQKWTTPAAAPFAREVPRLDLLEAPFLRTWAFFVAAATPVFICDRSVGRERHVTERIGAQPCVPRTFKGTAQGLASSEWCDSERRTKHTARMPRLDRVGPERRHDDRTAEKGKAAGTILAAHIVRA